MTGIASDTLGLYISVPFCRSKCTYCNFASGVYPASEHDRYVARLIEDLSSSHASAAQMGVELPRRVDTVYLGGGTPSLLAPELIARLFAAMRAEFDLEPDAEITVECAPGQLTNETLDALLAAGVNRVSLGVQSFIDREAALSGRLHSRAVVLGDIARLRAAGIANLNVDLIAGLAGQTFASWEESLAVIIDSSVPHASVYMLEVDQDSRLGREMLVHGARYHADLVPADDAIAQMYSVAIEWLDAAGLAQYEISNFSRPGFHSRHNLRYWQRRPYLGLGLDASSMLRESAILKRHASGHAIRKQIEGADLQSAEKGLMKAQKCQGMTSVVPQIQQNKSRALAPEACFSEDGSEFMPPSAASLAAEGRQGAPSTFSQALKPLPFKAANPASCCPDTPQGRVLRTTTTGELQSYLAGSEPVETTWLSPAQHHEEAWFLGLRLNAGVEVAALQQEFGPPMVAPALDAVKHLVDAALLVFDGKTVRLTAEGQLLSNDVFQEFLGSGCAR